MALPLREILGIPESQKHKALIASAEVLEAAQDRVLNLNRKLAISQEVKAAWMQFQSASYGYMYGHQPAVRSVVDYIASNVVELGPKLYERKGDTERKEHSDHPAAAALREPNPWTPGRQFIFDLFADFLVFNNAYALKIKPPGSERLFLLGVPASAVGVLGQGVYQLAGYQIFRSDGSNFTVPPEDMIHWRGYDAAERRMGISKLETLRAELAEQAASQRANVDLMESGLQQRGYIKRPLEAPDWRKDGGKDRFVEQFRAAMQRASRGYPVLEEGMEIVPLGVSPKDAQMLDSRRLFADEVAAQYGMVHCPPEGEEERRQFYADVLPPLCSLFCDFLRTQYLQPEFMVDDYYFEFNLDKKQMSDNRLQALTSAAGVPPLLRNEARAMLNLPPVKGGDEPVTPANVLAGTKPSTGAMPPQDPNGPPQDGSFRPGQLPKPPAPAKQATPTKAMEPEEELELEFALAREVKEVEELEEKAANWIEKQGGLPQYIKRISKHLRERGMMESHAIAVAVNAAKRMCATGDTNFPGKQSVNPGSRGEACAAVAQWEAMKARAHASAIEELELKRFNPRQPRDPHTGQWIDVPGGIPGVPRIPSAPSSSQDPAWHTEDRSWSSDVSWQDASEVEWLRAPSMIYHGETDTMEHEDVALDRKIRAARKRRREALKRGEHEIVAAVDRFLAQLPKRPGKALETPRFKADMARQRRNIDEATGVLQEFYARQHRILEKKALNGTAFDMKRWNRELARDLIVLFRGIIDREGGIYAERLGADDFDMRQIENYVKATARKLAERVNEVTLQDVERGSAAEDLEQASEQRALIAGTGIGTKATVFARQEAARQAPEPDLREQIWVANTDRHADLHGMAVALGEDWNGIEPGQEPNCACSVVIQ